MSCAPPSGWTVAEWIVDASPLVMGLEFRDFFDRDHCFSLFLYEIPGGRSFPPWPSFFFAEYFFRTLGKLRIKKTPKNSKTFFKIIGTTLQPLFITEREIGLHLFLNDFGG
jgi:hypothetical protein